MWRKVLEAREHDSSNGGRHLTEPRRDSVPSPRRLGSKKTTTDVLASKTSRFTGIGLITALAVAMTLASGVVRLSSVEKAHHYKRESLARE